MDTAEDKETAKVEAKQIDSLYFVVRELDAIHKRIDRVEALIENLKIELKADINRLENDIKDLRAFMIKLTFSMAGLIMAGVAILFQIMR